MGHMEAIDPRIDPQLVPLCSKATLVAETQQDVYKVLPSIRTPRGTVISRWTFSPEERALIAQGHDVFLACYTFNKQLLQPVFLSVGPADYTEE